MSRKVKGKKYPKYVLTVPPKHITDLGWQKGTELEIRVEGHKLIVEPKRESNEKS